MTTARLALPFALLFPLACEKDPAPPTPPAADPPASTTAVNADDDGEAAPAADEGAGAKKNAGEACLAASECDSGVCEGEGCGEDQPGTCAASDRMCTRDYVQYCGCDGESFGASGSCAGQRYAHKGEC